MCCNICKSIREYWIYIIFMIVCMESNGSKMQPNDKLSN